MTKTALDNILREKNIESITNFLKSSGEDVVRVSGNTIAFPTTDSENNDAWIEITIKVPKGERIPKDEGGGFAGYDGYSIAEFYQQESERKADEAAKRKVKAEAKKAASEAKKNKKKPQHSNNSISDNMIGGMMVKKIIEAYEQKKEE
jgi:hypothetical protein